MSRLIDADELKDSMTIGDMASSEAYENMNEFKKWIDERPTVEAIPKADYESRLKDDMVAMLIELRQDIIAESWHIESFDINANDLYDLVVQISDVDKIIQQKIQALKEQEDGNIRDCIERGNW